MNPDDDRPAVLPPLPQHPPPRLPCGCPLDSGCDGYHPGALGSASGYEP